MGARSASEGGLFMTRPLFSCAILIGSLFPGLDGQDAGGKAIQDVLKEALQAAEKIPDPMGQSQALAGIGKIQAKAGFKDQSKITFNKAFRIAENVENDPKKKKQICALQFFVAEKMLEGGDISGAIKTADKINDTDYRRSSFLRQVGHAYIDSGDWKKAMEIGEKLGFEDVRLDIALKKPKNGDWKGAYEFVISLKDEYRRAEMLVRLGDYLLGKDKKQDAIKLFFKARKLMEEKLKESLQVEIRRSLVDAFSEAGETKTALHLVDGMKSLDKYADYYREQALVNIYIRSKNLPESLRHARKSLEKWPRTEYLFLRIATAQAEAGDLKGAKKTIGEMRFGYKVNAMAELSKGHSKRGNKKLAQSIHKEAMEIAESAAEDPLQKSFPLGKAETFYDLSLALAEAGEADAARAWLARQKSPNWQAWGYLGVAQGLLKKKSK